LTRALPAAPTLFPVAGPPLAGEEDVAQVRERVLAYARGLDEGTVVAGRWVRLAARRFLRMLEDRRFAMDWTTVAGFDVFARSVPLVLSHAGQPFALLDWQLWIVAAVYGFRWVEDGRRVVRFAVAQVARKNGKSTFMALVALWELRVAASDGARVHVIAGKKDQAEVILGTAMEMYRRRWPAEAEDHVRYNRIELKDRDCLMTALTAAEKTLDGLNPSCWIGDEASEWRGRFLTKMTTSQGAREDGIGWIVTTPGNNRDLIYTSEVVEVAAKVLTEELDLPHCFYALFGIDEEDDPGDEAAWPKANPSLASGLPPLRYLREQWASMSVSGVGRSEFCRFHGARFSNTANRWLDMSYWDEGGEPYGLEELRGRPAWGALDLSRSFDLTALTLAVPLDDGRIALVGRYWWPERSARNREVEYGIPLRRWHDEHRITLTPGEEVDYEAVRAELQGLRRFFDLRQVAYDRWGTKYLRDKLANEDGIPIAEYAMDGATVGPGCQVFQNLWVSRRLSHNGDPILRRCAADAAAKRDVRDNLRPVKIRRTCVIDALVTAVMAVHCWSLTSSAGRSMYEDQGLA
jgi:phage terminase large subunit-like protein